MPAALLLTSVALTGYSAYQQNKAARNAAQIDTATADYNAKQDIVAAQQLEMDTAQNLKTMRQEANVYLSQQEASYAAAGVLANSGSPLAAQIVNAGRLTKRIQQEYVNSQRKVQQYYSAAKVGRLEGAAQAQADRAAGTIALINGGASIAGLGFQGYASGIFGKGGG